MNRSKLRSRSAFTLVELLVVIAIIGILVALLLPAIQAAREASRRSACGNNLKQLGTAIQNYHDIYKCLPINYGGNGQYNNTGTGRSWIIGILPLIEQQPLYDQIDFTRAIGDNTAAPPGNYTPNTYVAMTPIPALLCPSDGNNGGGVMGGRANVGGTWGVNNYKSCAGGNWNWGDHVGVVQPSGPYPNSNNGLDQGNGIICRNSGNDRLCYEKLANITDGTSTTFAVGECVPAWSTHSWWFWFNAATATCGIPLNYRIENGDQWMSTAAQAGDWTRNYSFFSRHPGGAQFAMCDASTRFISNSVDLIVYRATATISGGEAVKLP